MTTYFVSRHPGARQWIEKQNIKIDRFVEHLDVDALKSGDIVIGSLPVNLVYEVCRRGAHYRHLSLAVPEALRGQELSAEQLDALEAKIEDFVVQKPVQSKFVPEKLTSGAHSNSLALFAFLGTGKYDPGYHTFPNQGQDDAEIKFASVAIAKWLAAKSLVVFVTQEAKNKHWDALVEEARQHVPSLEVLPVEVKVGKSVQELKENFRSINEVMAAYPGQIAFDITHGFRSSSFLAAAVISHLNHMRAEEAKDVVEVYYAAFDARQEIEGKTKIPVWDLTWLTELNDWSAAINQLLVTGHGRSLQHQVEQLSRRLRKRYAQAQQYDKCRGLESFSKALQRFSQDLDAVRVSDLIFKADKGLPSAVALARAIRSQRYLIQEEMPELTGILDKLEQLLSPFRVPVQDFNGQDVVYMKHLANLYLRFHRYPEALIVLREAVTSALSPAKARCPGQGFDDTVRKMQDKQCGDIGDGGWHNFLNIRNDVMHAGMRKDPLNAEAIQNLTTNFVHHFDALLAAIKKED